MKIYLVGGAVRDQLLGWPIKERDWVVVGATVSDMLRLGYKQVGKDFPVFLHPQTNEEYALARMERKVQPGYKGFTFDTSPQVTLEEDLIRRDLTINAMAETPEGKLVDPYHGKEDLEARMLRHVSPAFAEDPVRILRVGRFLARYAHVGFKVAPETIELMHQMVTSGEVDALVPERVWKELERALGEPNPEQFFTVLAQCGALPILFPSLRMDGLGLQALQAAAYPPVDTTVRFAVLLHAMPEDISPEETPAFEKQVRATCNELCHRYRVPNAYRELALLTACHFRAAFDAETLHVDRLLSLFSALDIYRREERFQQFLLACKIISHVHQRNFDAEWLFNCAQIVKSVDVQALIAQGFTGQSLAIELKNKRREILEAWLSAQAHS